jgi:WD40 repeat protein
MGLGCCFQPRFSIRGHRYLHNDILFPSQIQSISPLLFKINFFKFLASSDGAARLWDVAEGTVQREYTGHQKAITALALEDIAKE